MILRSKEKTADKARVSDMDETVSIVLEDAASRILIIGGLVHLVWGLMTGIPMGTLRMNGKEVPRYLTLSHMGGLMQGPLLLGLVFAVHLSKLAPLWETVAASSVAVASTLLVIKDTLNWWLKIEDEFAERPPWFHLGVVLVPLYIVGILVLCVGVVASLGG